MEELSRQLQQTARLTFSGGYQSSFEEALPYPVLNHHLRSGTKHSAASWDSRWNMTSPSIRVHGSVGQLWLMYQSNGDGEHRVCCLSLVGRLAQLDWDALEKAATTRG